MVSQDVGDTFNQEASPAIEYIRILNRRKLLIGTIALLVIAAAVSVASFLPATYQSVATILIEEPGVSDDLVRSTDTGFADQRLQLIQQRVMTTAKLIAVIDKLGLYQEARATTPVNVLAETLRSQISLTVIGADSAEAKASRTARKTTAFTLGFTGRDPAVTQQITRELVDLYMAENERSQRSKAMGTAGFLTSESNRLSARIRDLEAQLAEFKTKNAGLLPEEFALNVQLLDRTQSQLLEAMRQVQSVRERQVFLQAQLMALDPQAPVDASKPETLSPRARLRLLKSQYSTMSAKYGAQHPDAINLRRQIEALDGDVEDGGAADIDALQAELAAAKQKYGDKHPEIQRLQRELKAARKKGTIRKSDPAAELPDNPLYVQTQGQLSALNAELSMGQSQISALQTKIDETEARVFKSPEVERGYLALKREYDNAVSKYQDLQARESQADLAKNLETEQMGERLSLIEPPPLPITPIAPNRPAIVLFGIVLGCLGGVGAGFLADSLDGRVYGHRRLAAVLGVNPLAVIPRIVTAYDRRQRNLKIAMITGSAGLALFTLVAVIRIDASSLDTAWTLLLDRIGVS